MELGLLKVNGISLQICPAIMAKVIVAIASLRL